MSGSVICRGLCVLVSRLAACLQDIFVALDSYADGTLTRPELGRAYKLVLPEASDDDVEDMCDQVPSHTHSFDVCCRGLE